MPDLERQRTDAARDPSGRGPEAVASERTATEPALLTWMRHEIRTPVNALVGMANLLADTELSASQREYVTSLRESAERLSRLVDSVLDLARLAAGQLTLEAHVVDVAEVVEAAFDEVAPRAAARGLDLLCDLAEEVPGTLVGDENRLRQLLATLLEQAIQRTHAGEVELALSARPSGGRRRLQVAVRDTGIPLPEEERARLMRPLADLVGSGARPGGSQDLAFALSRGLVERMGGTFRVDTDPHGGTVVSVELPLSELDEAAARDRRTSRLDLRGQLLLVIDDNATERALIARYGGRLGAQVHATASWAEARAWLEEGMAVDRVLFDERLPSSERDAFLEQLTRWAPHARLIPLDAPAPRGSAGQPPDRLAQPLTPGRLARVLGPRGAAAAARREVPALRILIGEDDPASRKVLLGVLERLGYQADVAVNGRQVLERLAQGAYDVLLLDMHMPEVDGETVVRHLVAQVPAARRPRVVAISATDAAEDRARWFAVGVDTWVSKTLPLADLQAALGRAVGGHARETASPAAAPGEALRALEASGAADLASQVARAFLDDATGALDTLEAAVAHADTVALEQAAHRLKGSAAMVGATPIVEACTTLIAAARRGALADAAAALADARRALGTVRPAFEHYAAGTPRRGDRPEGAG